MDKRVAKKSDRRKAARDAAFTRQGGECFYCGVKMLREAPASDPHRVTADHIIPVARGGRFHPTNIVAACFTCNNSRGTKEAAIFLAEMVSP